MSTDLRWGPDETFAFRQAWKKLCQNINSITEEEGLKDMTGSSIGVRFRNHSHRKAYENYLAVYLGRELTEKFQRLSNWTFSVKSCRFAFEGKLCLWCKQTFANGLCDRCQDLPEARRLLFRTRTRKAEQTNLSRRGVRNVSHDPSVMKKIQEAFRRKDPSGKATNAMHLREVRVKHAKAVSEIDQEAKVAKQKATHLENWGYSSWMTSGAGRRLFKEAIKSLYAVDNVMKDPQIREHHKRVMRDLFQDADWVTYWKHQVREGTIESLGVDNAFKHPDIIEKIQQRMLARYGKRHALQVKHFMKKYWTTCIDKFGGHPMTVPEIRSKQLRSSFNHAVEVIAGKEFVVQGYESFVLHKLLDKLGVDIDDIDSQPEGFKINRKKAYHPDFYLKSRDTYLEVKSSFTLLQGHGGDSFSTNVWKAHECTKLGKRVKWLVAYPSKDKVIGLPDDWYKWPQEQVELYLQQKLHAPTQPHA